MKKMIITAMVFGHFFVFSQEKPILETYNYGHNGMQIIVKENKGMTIVSSFHSKIDIKDEIALKVLDYYTKTLLLPLDSIIIKGDKANVMGKLVVTKKGKLTSVNFYYEKVLWKTGLTEIYTGKS